MFNFLQGKVSKEVLVKWKSNSEDTDFKEEKRKITWTKGTRGVFQHQLEHEYGNPWKELTYGGNLKYYEDGKKIRDLQDLQNELEIDVASNKNNYKLRLTLQDLNSNNGGEKYRYSPPITDAYVPRTRGPNGELRALLDSLQHLGL